MEPKTAKRRSNFRRANRIMPRRRIDIATEAIDYKNPDLLKKFVTENGARRPRALSTPQHFRIPPLPKRLTDNGGAGSAA
jgi:small subunit ribosomal protein S18